VRIEVHNHEAATEAFRDLSLASRVGLDDDAARGGKVVWFEWEHPASEGQGDAVLEADGELVDNP
jgi:hypothetical protein